MVVILAVTLGLFGTLFILALSKGMVVQKIDDSIHNEISHIQIHQPEFIQDQSLAYSIDSADRKTERIRSLPDVKAATSRVKTMAMASTAATGVGVEINGIDPAQEQEVTDISRKLTDGTYFKSELTTPLILISQKLATRLNARLGSKIVITTQNMQSDLVYGLFRVTGIYKTSNAMFDETNVFVNKHDFTDLTGFDPASATEIAVLLDRTEQTDIVTAELKKMYPSLNIASWKELQPILLALSSMMDQFSYALLIIILLAMAFGIVNTMLMAILERTRELGMLMAVGMNRRRVFVMIMLETIFLTVVGAAVGISISALTINLTSKNGINFAAWAEGFESFGYSALIYPTLYGQFYVIMTILVIVTAILSSIYPARKALKFNPAEAIRTDA